ncbi:hypothetical protein [Leeuwenhoekiella sp. NPDC079379]|uniref:hypothetical protein n=1 Tax=Leeuwenhoekiella sp. NPDC079379 TaxID=3364122 RepID=UPI0037C8528D
MKSDDLEGYVINAVIGQTVRYISDNMPKPNRENLRKIIDKAHQMLGSKIDKEDGSVSPKILRDMVNYGSFSEDVVSQEYYAGVLALSRCKDGRDDRGIYYLNIINRLSSYQLRLHYLIFINYKNHRSRVDKIQLEIDKIKKIDGYSEYEFSVEIDSFLLDLEYIRSEMNFADVDNDVFLKHSFAGLIKEGLFTDISLDFIDKKNNIYPNHKNQIPDLGFELFNWGTGIKEFDSIAYYDKISDYSHFFNLYNKPIKYTLKGVFYIREYELYNELFQKMLSEINPNGDILKFKDYNPYHTGFMMKDIELTDKETEIIDIYKGYYKILQEEIDIESERRIKFKDKLNKKLEKIISSN